MSDRDWTVRRSSPSELVESLVGAPPGDGPCGSRLRAVAEESATQVRLTVVDDNTDRGSGTGEPVACSAIGHLWALPVTLKQDLGSRTIVDADGRTLDLALALAPTRLPEGYELGSESGSPSHHMLNYGSADGGWLRFATWHEDTQRPAERAFTALEHREVDGRTFRLLENEMQKVVAFEVDGRSVWAFWMRQHVDSRASLDWEALVDVAASVR